MSIHYAIIFTDKIFNKLYSELLEYRSAKPLKNISQPFPEKKMTSLKRQLENIKNGNEERVLKQALEETKYSKTKTAKLLGISRSTLWKKLKKAGLD